MKPSPTCLELIKRFEGLRLEPYYDLAGNMTIGYGHKIGIGESKILGGISLLMADALFADDVNRAGRQLDALVLACLNQNQFDALVSFVFNLGIGALERSTLLTKLDAYDFDGAADEILRWDHVGFTEVTGLKLRREAECELFKKGDA